MQSLVNVTETTLTLPTYPEPPAEEMPMFAKHRVHQRSSGNPYPARVVLEVRRDCREEKSYTCLRLENAYLRVEILPELGGRVYSALDKTTGYDFFYKQHVIKPALIGLLGSWISGGCEFNWPCHHRPSTFMPVDWAIEWEADGSATVWLSEHDPLNRMKGMVGIRLAPESSLLETRVRVYNRTPVRHSFLWWENAAVPVDEQYRLFFPPDVRYVQFHYRKNVTTYPVASGVYNGIRMGEGTDISRHRNTRQPTSYFCAETRYDFFGGYDEGKRRGVVHVADRHTSIGKKMFTWAYGQLGASWEAALTDTDGAYAELMAGSYSANQPDFTWLEPYETKEFSQAWYPIGELGVPLCATADAAISLADGVLRVQATRPLADAVVTVDGQRTSVSLAPGQIVPIPADADARSITLTGADGAVLLAYRAEPARAAVLPDTLPNNPTLDNLATAEACYLAGVHVDQYRDPAITPDAYYREALRREPDFAPALVALARFEYEHFRYDSAHALALRGWRALTAYNNHPESGEPAYLLGLISEALGRADEAMDWHQKAAYQQDARSRAMTRAAMLYGQSGAWAKALMCAERAVAAHAGNMTAETLAALALTRLGRANEAAARLDALLARDPLWHTARLLRHGPNGFYGALRSDAGQTCLDIAEDLVAAGETSLAQTLLARLPAPTLMTEAVRAHLAGEAPQMEPLPLGIAYPSRGIEREALLHSVTEHPGEATAQNLLACLEYASGNADAAIGRWQSAIAAAPEFYMPYRNLAAALYSARGERREAVALLEAARARRPGDAQLVFERAYVMGRAGIPPEDIAAFLGREAIAREDVRIEHARALNRYGQYEDALRVMTERPFTPCEGGEHAVAEQYMFAQYALGMRALAAEDHTEALRRFRAAQVLPDSLGAGLWHEALLVPAQYREAVCLGALGDARGEAALLAHILALEPDYFSDMHLPELPCWQAMAYLRAGRPAPAGALLAAHIRRYEAARAERDAGFFKTTPFFLSYQEPAHVLRAAACDWQLAMAEYAAGNLSGAASFAARSLAGEPFNLYARLMANDPQEGGDLL